MPHSFNQQDIYVVSDDLKVFLNAVKGPIDKLDYFNTILPIVEKAASIEINYRIQNIDIIPEVENAVILQMEQAEKKQIRILLYLSPASFMVNADKLFLQQIFFRLIRNMLEACETKSVISVYVTNSDDKCMIEVLSQKDPATKNEEENYFKKYRINNPLHTGNNPVLLIYKKMMEDMLGELSFSFNDEKQLYFRLKFPLV